MTIDQSLGIELPRNPGKTTKRLHLAMEPALPSVDILLPCCGEPLDMLLDTIRAICVIDYPQSSFRVLVLDDGNSIQLREWVEKLCNTWPNLLYYSRGIKPNQKVFAKAGNLNYALFDIHGKMKQPPEFIVGFDSDFFPAPNFLRATLPHLLKDDTVGLVSAQQDFYNLPLGDPLGQDLAFCREIIFPGRNELGSSIATGSGFVMRRELAVQVGGFPTINEIEDVTLSVILPAHGKRILALEEMLQLGRVPTSLEGHVRQRRRWVTGCTQMIATPWAACKESIPPASRSLLTWIGLACLWGPLSHSVGCAMIIPALISGKPLVPSMFLRLQIAISLVTFGFVWLYEWLKAAATGFRLPTFAHLHDFWMCADQLCAVIRFHLFGSQGGRCLVTGNSQNNWNNANNMSTRLARLKCDLWDCGVGFSLLFTLGTLAGVMYSAIASVESNSRWQIHAMTTLLFPPVTLICYITLSCHMATLRCVVWPPHYPPRDVTLDTHPSDVRAVFPCEEVRQYNARQRLAPLGYRGHLLLIPAYVTVMAMMYFLYL
ncbi:hypothetical protein ANOM_002307 [Aspergillus nomiae NRRL 13137]|uniref:Glycosyltransferase 2-like domain-containing protein n=1 Tax=Aspergillus nomiae NRRL (strain ATCC 15546 / NRRL 13137 / CBS 260.88 / M93) TaxID=1509407 RepID=A0A0L1JDA6_ASPN3|nr:uncharacterized protein ANOM_002307 [Aspergillus nomiae NRRL 13137]KNG89711.1 hypothetical protein ANOM_002307 [Aspergillus nomiae NRRL 13137]